MKTRELRRQWAPGVGEYEATDRLAVALYRAAILEADRILRRWAREGAHDPGRFAIGDVLALERTLKAIAAELAP